MEYKDFLLKHYKLLTKIVILIALPAVYLFVYYTGGIKYVYSHTMYIPIFFAGIILSVPYGLLTGLIGGILLGPFMPISVETGEAQVFINWFYRLVVFVAIGGLGDYFSSKYKHQIKKIYELTSKNQETNIPNMYYLDQIEETQGLYSVFSVIISDRDYILDIFDIKIYNRAMAKIYQLLKKSLPDQGIIIQSDSNILWVMIPLNNTKEDTKQVQKALKKPIIIDGYNIFVEYYIGVAKPSLLERCQTLEPFQQSDRLARYAKERSLQYVLFDEQSIRKQFDFKILSDFEIALENNQLYIAYQPIYNTKTNKIHHIEALIRWQHPKRGLIPPNQFIPPVEKTQLIHKLFSFVLDKVTSKIEEFIKEGINECPISINLSGNNFADEQLFEKINEVMESKNISHKMLSFEITETVLMKNPKRSQKYIQELRNLGVTVSIDDFGKGYSTFTYISRFKVDYLKIDKYFVANISDESIENIVKATIKLAHQLGIEVVAEWVESKKIYDRLIKLGCEYVQGFYLAKPIHQDKIIDYYKKQM
ncbi:MAG: EAL domain-containing protein [Candidatus Izimaplasma sp.]|nr:EAL domain-containing protein [Candidatus Izimaplasma bacterium]